MAKKLLCKIGITLAVMTLTACGFKPQGNMPLAKPLHTIYVKSINPYGNLTHYLETYLKTSSVKLAANNDEAETMLIISQDMNSQELIGVSSTQQTRQYNLHVSVTFEVANSKGQTIISPQSLTETRAITIQSDQILGSSNEATLYYQQMRRELAYEIMNRLSSRSTTRKINAAFHLKTKKSKS